MKFEKVKIYIPQGTLFKIVSNCREEIDESGQKEILLHFIQII